MFDNPLLLLFQYPLWFVPNIEVSPVKVQALFLLFFLVAAGVLAWFTWYVSTPLLIPVGGEEPSSYPVAGSLVMEPVEAVSSDGTAIEGYLVRPGRPEALSPRQSRVRDTLKLRGKMPHLEAKPELVVIAASWNEGVESSLPLAEGLQTSLRAVMDPENTRAVKPAPDTVFLMKNAPGPAVTVECGFLSNSGAADMLHQIYRFCRLACPFAPRV